MKAREMRMHSVRSTAPRGRQQSQQELVFAQRLGNNQCGYCGHAFLGVSDSHYCQGMRLYIYALGYTDADIALHMQGIGAGPSGQPQRHINYDGMITI